MRKVKKYKGLQLASHIFESCAEVARVVGVTPQSINDWKKHNSVPKKHRAKIVEEAKKRGFEITENQLRSDL